MYKINLTNYEVVFNNEKKEYDVKSSIIECLFNRGLNLNATLLLQQSALANRIAASGKELVVDEEEYKRIRAALETMSPLGASDVEFVKRIVNAKVIKPKKK